MSRGTAISLLVVVALGQGGCAGRQGDAAAVEGNATPTATATNHSAATLCAEQDNVNITLSGSVRRFAIEATHPAYSVGNDNCAPDFTNCPPDATPTYPFTPKVYKLFDDGETVVEAVREATWWRPRGMIARVDEGARVRNIHYLRLYRKIAGAAEWPQVLVLYMDGNLRLIPQPPVGCASVCFGSSVIVGPAAVAERPLAEIRSVRYVSSSQTLTVAYVQGGTATIRLQAADRQRTRVTVFVSYPTDSLPCATFRSMYVRGGNADVDHVLWTRTGGQERDSRTMSFPGGPTSEWFFHRTARSRHNISAPDIRLTLLK
jgi:hypothetical protein